MNFLKKWWFITKISIILLVILIIACKFHVYLAKPEKKITVFVHGTFMTTLAMLNPFKTYNQTISSDDWYHKCLSKLRKNPSLFEDSIILQEGLCKIDSSILSQYSTSSLTPNYSKKGAYQAIGAYDTLLKATQNSESNLASNKEYYTFGFSGLLSDAHRKEAGHDLYKEVNKLIKKTYNQGYIPVINICAYSHGGNVALYLADAENIYKQNVKINSIILYGTPIQSETAVLAINNFNNIFKNIYNFYSEGDTVQNNDSLSTASSKSFRTFKELCSYKSISLDYFSSNIFDLRLLAQDDPNFFGHFHYWFFDRYPRSWLNSDIQLVVDALDPLPVAVLTPIFLELLENYKSSSNINNINNNNGLIDLDLSILCHKNKCKICIIDPNNKQKLCQSLNLSKVLHKIQTYSQVSWKPYAKSGEVSKIGIGLLAALQSIVQK